VISSSGVDQGDQLRAAHATGLPIDVNDILRLPPLRQHLPWPAPGQFAEQVVVETMRAIGAADWAPKPPFSTSTASAIFGLSAGA
jgi:hypothetical protein